MDCVGTSNFGNGAGEWVLMLESLVLSSGTSEEIIARSDSLNNSVALSVIGIALDSYCSSRAGKQRHLYILLLAVQYFVWGRLITFKPWTRKLQRDCCPDGSLHRTVTSVSSA